MSYLYFEKPTPVISDKIKILGFNFSNRVGLASGMDKNADYIDSLSHLGFGFLELGTVTPRAQAGNAKPRLFRLTEKRSLLNSMGFNNKGVEHAVLRIQKNKSKAIIGLSIGKNYDTPLEKAIEDYLFCFERAYPVSDYIAVNISSPNTPGLRDLQYGAALDDLLQSLKNEQLDLIAKHNKQVPMLVKIAPDLDQIQIEQVSESLLTNQIDGVIATNTTLERSAVMGQQYADEAGGLSGSPVRERSTHVVSELKRLTQGKLPIIGVGGIDDAQSAQEKLNAGANLVQVYTGFIYKGPQLVKSIVDSL